MTKSVLGRGGERRQAAVREVLDTAWTQMEQHGVAALSLRELARTLDIRPQSLAHYFPTKSALLDALFRDGFAELDRDLRGAGGNNPDEALIAAVQTVLAFCVASPARYHLMLQRTVPGFTPTDTSHEVALAALGHLLQSAPRRGRQRPRQCRRLPGNGQRSRRRTDRQRPRRTPIHRSGRTRRAVVPRRRRRHLTQPDHHRESEIRWPYSEYITFC